LSKEYVTTEDNLMHRTAKSPASFQINPETMFDHEQLRHTQTKDTVNNLYKNIW